MTKMPARIQNDTTLRSARIRRIKGTSRYYVDLYNTDGRLSSLSPDSRRTFSGPAALDMALAWVA